MQRNPLVDTTNAFISNHAGKMSFTLCEAIIAKFGGKEQFAVTHLELHDLGITPKYDGFGDEHIAVAFFFANKALIIDYIDTALKAKNAGEQDVFIVKSELLEGKYSFDELKDALDGKGSSSAKFTAWRLTVFILEEVTARFHAYLNSLASSVA